MVKKMYIGDIIETLLQRDKYKESPVNITPRYAINGTKINILKNKKNEKEYVEKGYKPSMSHKMMTSLMASYEYVGYYVANRILEDYKLEGFSIPKPKGITVVDRELKLLIDRAPGKSVAQHLVKGRNPDEKEERHMEKVDKYNIVGFPLFDLIGHRDTHEGNTILSKSGKINFIDFEAAFGKHNNINELFITQSINALNSPYATSFDKKIIKKFFKNLLKLRFINDATVFGYIEEAIREILLALTNEDFNKATLKLKLENMFMKGEEKSTVSENIIHIKNMIRFLKEQLEERNMKLEF